MAIERIGAPALPEMGAAPGARPVRQARPGQSPATEQTSFAEVLRGQQAAAARPAVNPAAQPATGEVRFSAHARARLEQRGVSIGPEFTARIGQALDEAAAKGARETLLLVGQHALIASVPNRTVITAMTPDAAQGAVFTQIDSAVVVPQGGAATLAPSNNQADMNATTIRRDPFGDAFAPRTDRSGATRG